MGSSFRSNGPVFICLRCLTASRAFAMHSVQRLQIRRPACSSQQDVNKALAGATLHRGDGTSLPCSCAQSTRRDDSDTVAPRDLHPCALGGQTKAALADGRNNRFALHRCRA